MEEQTKEQLQGKIIALRDSAEDGFIKYQPQFEELERGYLAMMSDKQRRSLDKRKKSNLSIQLIAPKVEAVVRETMASFFENDKLAEIIPENGDDISDVRVAEMLQQELKEYSQQDKLYTTTKLTVLNTLVYGTGVLKVYWSKQQNKARFENCSLQNIWFDPDAASADDIKYMVHRIKSMTVADLKVQHPSAKVNWEELTQHEDTNATDEVDEYKRVEVIEVYRLVGQKWKVSTIVEDETFVRTDEELKDGLPFVFGRAKPQFTVMDENPVRAYGGSLIEHLLSLQKEYNIRRNQQIDAINRDLDPRIVTTKQSGISEVDLLSNKKKLEIDDISNFKVLDDGRIDSSTFDTDKIEGEAQEVSGVAKYTQGLNDQTNLNQTATAVKHITSKTNSVVDDNNRSFNETLFRPLLKRLVLLTYKYQTGSRWAGVNRSKPMSQKVLINVGTGSANREVRLENLQQAIDSLQQQIQLYMQIQDERRVADAVDQLEKLNDEKLALLGVNTILEAKDTKDDSTDRDEAANEQRRNQDQAAAAGAGVGGRNPVRGAGISAAATQRR